ncbi:hypothetical protein DICSQDRAFT_128063 [Dichomitus squalens LYAD-421 SS1]|uniref:Uncharacterized protein n=1 Tax=Dichomitus squalens (strain LYAD-421) TaxID=732165 RepID=R7SXM7_DICSQ|nr:uncharacterized protein DICSQDRAFT_128063 [Dichomitus squalens LYAD-421 SS1]EJF59727.1 hypothetical protein DICSQDRAFT_128063 [Dichomitus squalens LYAD-421 SS1]
MTSASLVGSYVVLQINARAMVAEYADSPILALAKALGTQKYVALVEKEVRVASCSDEPMWRVYRVSFVGRHPRLRPGLSGSSSPSPDGCLPIYPATPSCHETAYAPVHPSKAFPKGDCCHRPELETFIRVHRQPHHVPPQWRLSDEQIARVTAMRESADPSITGSEASYVQVFTPTSHITSTSAAETSVSELFDRAEMRKRHDTMDSGSVYSSTTASTSTSVVVLLEAPSASQLALTLECDAYLDDIPLVDVSFDISELATIPDPAEFLEERNVVAQLVRKAETRERNSPAPSIHTADARSAFDVESRRPSLSRCQSYRSQTQRTVTSRAASPLAAPPIPPLPPIPAGPAKLRKSRSRASYKQIRADARSIRSERISRKNSSDGSRSDTVKEFGEGRERKRGDSFNSYSVLSYPGDAHGVALTERTLVEWLAAFAEKPVIIFRRPARAVRRWVRCIVLRSRRGDKARAKLSYQLGEDSGLHK